MPGIAFGLLAALSWGSGALVATHQVRAIGTRRSLAWVAVIGLALVAPGAAFVPFPSAGAASFGYAALSGIAYIAGWMCWSLAVRRGNVSLVTPVVSTDGAIAAVISVLAFGEALQGNVAVALGIVAAGVVITGIRREVAGHGRFTGKELALALAGAFIFGVSFVAGGEAESLGIVWTLLVSRLAAVALMLPVVLSRGAMRLPRQLMPWVVGSAALDLAGYAFFLLGARNSVAVASVLASQYAVVAVLGGLAFYRERLTPLQGIGLCTTLAGVTALAVFRG